MHKFDSPMQVISFLKSVINSGESLSHDDQTAINNILARPRGVISQELARDIWNCHNDIEKAHKLIAELQKDTPRPRRPDTPEDFKPGLSLWLDTGPGSHTRLVDVSADISLDVVQRYIVDRSARLNDLMLQAVCELDRANYVRGYSDGIAAPVDMIIFCPKCHTQHIDKAEPDVCQDCGYNEAAHKQEGFTECVFVAWLNPPHKSHRCGSCNLVFRIADMPTNGVAEIQTKGENDTWAN